MLVRGCEIQTTIKERCFSNTVKAVFYATDTLSGSGKVKKLEINGTVWKVWPKTVKAPYVKISSPYVCILE